MVLWDPNFTSEDAHYLLSFKEEETKTSMVKDILGMILPDEFNQENILKLPDNFGAEAWVAEWETFLTVAKPEQVEYIQSILRLSEMFQVSSHNQRKPVIWDSLPKALRKKMMKMFP